MLSFNHTPNCQKCVERSLSNSRLKKPDKHESGDNMDDYWIEAVESFETSVEANDLEYCNELIETTSNDLKNAINEGYKLINSLDN